METIANFQRNATGAFGHRLNQLVEIDREIEALLIKLFQTDIAEKWQGNLGLRAAFARRLAQISTRLAIAYRDLLDEGRRKYPPGSRGTPRLPAIACRAIVKIGLCMRWHCYANKREPSTSWGRLYRLYRFVEKRGIVGEKIALNDRANTTCHQEFARIILFGLADLAGRSPEMMDAAYASCGEWSSLVEFTPPAGVEGAQHCFDMEGNLPPLQFHPQMQSDRMRCFSTAAACFKVVSVRVSSHNIVGNDRTVQVDKQGAIVRQGAYQHPAHGLSILRCDNLIRHLMNGWVKARPARRVDRESDGLKVACVACLRANGSPIWRVGVVRWQHSAETGEPQWGIETLADNPKVLHLSLASGIDGGLPKMQTMNPASAAGSDIGQITGITTGLLPADIAELARRCTKIPDIDVAQNGLAHNSSRQSLQTAQTRQISASVIKALLSPRDASPAQRTRW